MGNRKKLICIIGGILLSAIILFIIIMCNQIKGDEIPKNVYINDIDVGGMNKSKAAEVLSEKYKIDNIKLMYLNKSWNISYKDINFDYDFNNSVEKAYSLNKKNTFFKNLLETTMLNFGKKEKLAISVKYDEQKISEKISEISKEINIDMKNATLSIDGTNIKVTGESEGKKIDIKKSIKDLEKQLSKGKLESELIVAKVEPSIKKEQLKDIDTLLGSYSTNIVGSVLGRNDNIRLSTQKSSDVLLMPNEQFSYNEHTGLRTVENGYKNAPVIIEGSLQEGLGGGVCQVSSTLYNAVLYSGLEIVNVKNHTIPSGYVPKGRDATVTDSGIDFIFKNNFKQPVYVKNYVSGNTIVCQIYGSSKDIQNIEIVTNTDQVSIAPTKKVDDTSLPKGKEKTLEAGRNGYTV